jgi:hypothetical protein
MKRMIAAALVFSVLSIGIVGCTDKTTIKRETKISTPGGTTTITTEREVKKTGENPPAARP